ncbi:hypothetical protein [Pseudonocardia zijingensis]|uniref:Uncharacterized protein n=1 Tax=Pseudonocardia zijingensis TaxID=153376 RepID=A0ABN1PD82_9PSEU
MPAPDPYRTSSEAPKHWIHIPAQRSHPPAPDQLDAAISGEDARPAPGQLTVVAIALAVAVAVIVLIGIGGPISGGDAPPQVPSNGSFQR